MIHEPTVFTSRATSAIMEPQDQGDFGGWGERVEIFQHTR